MYEQIIIYINGAIYAGVMYYAFTCIFKPTVKKIWILLAYTAYIVITTQIFLNFQNLWINLLINMTAYFSLTFLFSGNIGTKLVFALFIYTMSILADGLSFLGLNGLHYLRYGQWVSAEYILPIGRTVSNIIFLPLILFGILLFRKLINRKARHQSFKIPVKYTVSALMMLLGIILINTILISREMGETEISVISITVSHFISSLIIFLIIWLYNTILNNLEEFEKNRLKDQMLERWEIQYHTAISSQRAIERLKHNLEYHFITLSSLLNKGETEKATQHITNEIGLLNIVTTTGNISIDTILSYYQQKIKETLKIDLEMELFIPSNMKLDAILTATILGNALENAMEACVHVTPTERYVHVNAKITPKKELLITITNPYVIEPVVSKAGKLETVKPDTKNHGIGLSSIQDILSEELGHIDFDFSDNTFQFTVLFYDVCA